jgi:adenosylcobinamide-GDP ribazoletransferase
MAPNKRGGPGGGPLAAADLAAAAARAAANGDEAYDFGSGATADGAAGNGAASKGAATDGAGADGGSAVPRAAVEARGRGTRERGDTHDGSARAELRVFWTAVMFFTRLPCPAWVDHHPAFLMRGLMWAPFVGVVVGGWSALWLAAAASLWPTASGVAAAASTLAAVWLTGCFHEDGLADCLDGLGGGWTRPQILAIMKDSRVGTYAVVGMGLVLALKLRALEALMAAGGPGRAAAALVAAHAAARWTSLPLLRWCCYLQDVEDAKRGLYNWFAQSQRLLTPWRVAFGTATAVLAPLALLGAHEALLLCATVLAVAVAAAYYADFVLGGVVGDYLGATIQVAELAAYLALLAERPADLRPLAALAAAAAVPVVLARRQIKLPAAQC